MENLRNQAVSFSQFCRDEFRKLTFIFLSSIRYCMAGAVVDDNRRVAQAVPKIEVLQGLAKEWLLLSLFDSFRFNSTSCRCGLRGFRFACCRCSCSWFFYIVVVRLMACCRSCFLAEVSVVFLPFWWFCLLSSVLFFVTSAVNSCFIFYRPRC